MKNKNRIIRLETKMDSVIESIDKNTEAVELLTQDQIERRGKMKVLGVLWSVGLVGMAVWVDRIWP